MIENREESLVLDITKATPVSSFQIGKDEITIGSSVLYDIRNDLVVSSRAVG
jgi:hypothetical protein